MKLIKVRCKDEEGASHRPGEKPVDDASYNDAYGNRWRIDFYVGKNKRWSYHAYAANQHEIERVDFRMQWEAFADAKKEIAKLLK